MDLLRPLIPNSPTEMAKRKLVLGIVELWRILQRPSQLGTALCLSWDYLGIIYSLDFCGDTLGQTFHSLYIIMAPLYFGIMSPAYIVDVHCWFCNFFTGEFGVRNPYTFPRVREWSIRCECHNNWSWSYWSLALSIKLLGFFFPHSGCCLRAATVAILLHYACLIQIPHLRWGWGGGMARGNGCYVPLQMIRALNPAGWVIVHGIAWIAHDQWSTLP